MSYIHATYDQGIELSVEVMSQPRLDTYTDAVWGGDFESAKSTNSYVSGFDADDGCSLAMTDWASKLQTVVALSSGEAEYVSAAACRCTSSSRSSSSTRSCGACG